MDIRKTVANTANRLRGLGKNATDSVSNKSDRLMLELREVRGNITSLGSTQIAQRIDQVFPKTSAPAFILHHSNNVDDFTVHFDLTHVLSQLDAGILARPSVVLYAGRSDVNRAHLSKRVTAEFLSEMKEHEARVKQLALENERTQRDVLDRSISTVVEGAVEATFMHAMLLLVTGPLGILVWLSMGSHRRTIDAIRALVSMPATMVRAGVETIRQPLNEKRVKCAIDEEHQKINKALSNLELMMHRDLIALAGSYDNVAYPLRGDRDTEDLPEHIVTLIRSYGGEYLPDRI